MTTAPAPLTASVVERDSILETRNWTVKALDQHYRQSIAYLSFLKRMMAKAHEGRTTAADEEAYQRRFRWQQRREKEIDDLVATHPAEALTKALREATGASQVA